MSDYSLVAVYENPAQAQHALERLRDDSFPLERLSVVGRNLTRGDLEGYVTAEDVVKSGAEKGSCLGGLLGILGAGAFVWIPGFGPLVVAGSLTAALINVVPLALTGAITGGFIGAMVGRGTATDEMWDCDEYLESGKVLVVAQGGQDELEEASLALPKEGLSNVTVHELEKRVLHFRSP